MRYFLKDDLVFALFFLVFGLFSLVFALFSLAPPGSVIFSLCFSVVFILFSLALALLYLVSASL